VHTVVVKAGDEIAGRYRLEELRGHDPMSEVCRAYDSKLDRTVALKMLSPTADLERFRREARAVAALAHENVMQVFDYGEDEAGPFMSLEWLPGGTLEERLAHGALPDEETHRVATGIAAGLAHLHARGLVHRDLKPANVLFDAEGRPKLGDLGLARRVTGPGSLTDAGTVLGTAAYISPEQAAGEPAGPASDVYSFGVILFRMLTGELPFVAEDPLALLDMHRRTAPPDLAEVRPYAPPALAALVAAALRKDPAQRPADGEALLAALGEGPLTIATPAETEATQILTPASAPDEKRSSRRTAAIALAIVLLAAAGGVLAWAVTRPPSTAPAGVVSTASTHAHTTQAGTTSSPLTTTAPPTTTAPTTTAPATTAHTRTAHTTTALPPTLPDTTVPTTTLPTLPTTTVPTTITVGTTTTPGATG
jgi:serine/threonine protein kinase